MQTIFIMFGQICLWILFKYWNHSWLNVFIPTIYRLTLCSCGYNRVTNSWFFVGFIFGSDLFLHFLDFFFDLLGLLSFILDCIFYSVSSRTEDESFLNKGYFSKELWPSFSFSSFSLFSSIYLRVNSSQPLILESEISVDFVFFIFYVYSVSLKYYYYLFCSGRFYCIPSYNFSTSA